MKIIYTIILAAATIFVLYRGYMLYRLRMAQKHKPRLHRMMVAVKRRQAGIARFLNMPPGEQTALLNDLETQWETLNQKWKSIGSLVSGFGSSQHGLPSGGDDEWMLFLFYDLADYEAYRRCVAHVDDPQFMSLRNHCEIRLMLGTVLREVSGGIKRLF